MILQFIRDYRDFSGGHLKVFHYFRHAIASTFLAPQIRFTSDSEPRKSLWTDADLTSHGAPEAYFLGGVDWLTCERLGYEIGNCPVINLIQGVVHANPQDIRHTFLRRRALRICVSREVSDAIASTGIVNGPIVTIPAAVDLLPVATNQKGSKSIDVFIGGLKNQTAAVLLAQFLKDRGVKVDLSLKLEERKDFLRRVASSTVAVLLPLEQEGFFLPALEAMALGAVVVVPDCIGNRSFCISGENCLMPSRYDVEELARCALMALSDQVLREKLTEGAARIVTAHGLERERQNFLEVARSYLCQADNPC